MYVSLYRFIDMQQKLFKKSPPTCRPKVVEHYALEAEEMSREDMEFGMIDKYIYIVCSGYLQLSMEWGRERSNMDYIYLGSYL